LEIRVAFVDDIVRSATPTEPPNRSTKVLRVKSLRETYHLIETASLAEAQRFVDTHPHPILWNLIADKALHQLQLDLAEVCYIHGENYRGTQLIGRLRKQKVSFPQRRINLEKSVFASFLSDQSLEFQCQNFHFSVTV
jgi:hypothetical protein